MKLSQPLSFLLLAAVSGSVAGANVKLTAATGTTSEYEPNVPRLTKTMRRTSIRRNNNNDNANVRKLSKAGGTDATDATGKSGKSSHNDGILDFLDPNGTNCPCFTTAMINEAWAAFQDQNPSAECSIEGDSTDFLAIVTENGFPPFEFIAKKFVEDRRRLANRAHGRRSGIRRNLGIGDSTIGYCEVVKESDGFMDPARTTLSGSYKDYDPTYFPDCVAEIEMSDMYADCQPPCRGRC